MPIIYLLNEKKIPGIVSSKSNDNLEKNNNNKRKEISSDADDLK